MIRKTKKYFREEVKVSMKRAFDAIPEICKKYGNQIKISPRKSRYEIYTENRVEGWSKDTTWWITGFCLHADKTMSVIVYWQGDSTDGNEYILFTGDRVNCISLPPTQAINMGSYWYVARNGINIYPNDIWEAIKGIKL